MLTSPRLYVQIDPGMPCVATKVLGEITGPHYGVLICHEAADRMGIGDIRRMLKNFPNEAIICDLGNDPKAIASPHWRDCLTHGITKFLVSNTGINQLDRLKDLASEGIEVMAWNTEGGVLDRACTLKSVGYAGCVLDPVPSVIDWCHHNLCQGAGFRTFSFWHDQYGPRTLEQLGGLFRKNVLDGVIIQGPLQERYAYWQRIGSVWNTIHHG